MNDQHYKHGNNNIKMNRERWESLGLLNCKIMVMVINTQTNKLGMQKKNQENLGPFNCRTMVMVTCIQTDTRTNRPGMHKKS
jgi:hypothetical protein